jgi:enolase
MKINNIMARQILDSRGTPTVEADVILENGIMGRASVPSGASTGVHEAHELRDNGKQYNGKSVLKAVANINTKIADTLKGVMADDQYLIDDKLIELDGTANKSNLGANSILAVSLACAHVASKYRGIPLYQQINDIAQGPKMSLPMPMMNVLNGGQHASNSSDFQEFMIIPHSASSYSEAVQIGAEIFMSLKNLIARSGHSTAVGDEGGFTYPVKSNRQMLDMLNEACLHAGYEPGRDIAYALDVASSEFFKDNLYMLSTENRRISTPEMINYLHDLIAKYPVVSIEDGLEQDQWQAWQSLTTKLSETQLVGDDLLVTNPERLERAIELKAGNAILIKPNQIGTLTETIKAINIAKKHGWNTIVSHRSGETEDTTIAHIAVGTGAGQIKTGSLSRSERNAKHNELMRIEQNNQSLTLDDPFKSN